MSEDGPNTPQPGSRRLYRPLSRIAEGGMGQVDLVLRLEGGFSRLYAVKRLRPAYRVEPEFRTMFLEEARIAGLLRHPNVVSVLDFGEDEEGPYLVMDFVEGVSVSALLRWTAESNLLLPIQLCLRIVLQAARGLHAVHELRALDGEPLSLVHRDVSPQNLLIAFDGTARITDFGIAKAQSRASRTDTGLLKGKAGYMSPEQLQFEPLDRRSDLFSLGVVLYELLAARRLYSGQDPTEAARRVLWDPPPDVYEARPDAHPAVVQLVFELLAKDRELRPRDASAVADRVEQVLHDLVDQEGPVRIEAFLAEHFEAWREQRRAWRQDLIRQVSAEGEGSTPPTHAPPHEGHRRLWLAGIALLALFAAAGASAGLAVVSGSSGDSAPSRAAEPATVGTAPPDSSEAAGESREASAAGEEQPEASDGLHEEPADTPPPETPHGSAPDGLSEAREQRQPLPEQQARKARGEDTAGERRMRDAERRRARRRALRRAREAQRERPTWEWE